MRQSAAAKRRELKRAAEQYLRENWWSRRAATSTLLDETLTAMRLDLPENLARVLSSTNLIENLFNRLREIAQRVKRWQGGVMILRWTAAGVLEAEHNFRKVAGYRALQQAGCGIANS
jgi:putative transposase